jgi:RNA polymerase sigma factor (sigma-70 family)
MKETKDEILIQNVKNKNCNESLKEIVNKHGGIIFSIGKKYCQYCGLDLNDLNDNKYWIIFNAIQSFDTTKGSKFSTWLGNQVRFFCLNHKNKNVKFVTLEDNSLEFILNNASKENSFNKKEIINLIIDLFNQISDPNTKKAIYYRYFYNKDRILNYSEIANILEVTPQTVLNWHNKFIKFAKKKLTNK